MIKIQPADLIRLAIELEPRAAESPRMMKALGKAKAASLTALAAGFGIAAQTARNWRADGMPGDSSKRQYSWAECFAWWLQRQRDNEERGGSRGAGSDTRRELTLLQVETEKANLEYRRARAARISDEFVPRKIVESEIATALSVLRETIMQIPAELQPRFPPELANELRVEATRICAKALNVAADRLARITAEETENGVTKNGRVFKPQ